MMIFTNSDGGARGNPGPGAIGIVVREDEKILEKYSKYIGKKVTNNFAEYTALAEALKLAARFTKGITTCYLDSELIVKQLNGKYKVKNKNLRKLFNETEKLKNNFQSVKFIHVSRENKFQKMADKLVNEELDKKL